MILYGTHKIVRAKELVRELNQIANGKMNLAALDAFFKEKLPELSDCISDTEEYMYEILSHEYPDEQRILNYEHEKAVEVEATCP